MCVRNTGHLFSIIVLIAYTAAYTITRQYMWINDNIGALQWAATQKCSSMASHYANLAVFPLNIYYSVVVCTIWTNINATSNSSALEDGTTSLQAWHPDGRHRHHEPAGSTRKPDR